MILTHSYKEESLIFFLDTGHEILTESWMKKKQNERRKNEDC